MQIQVNAQVVEKEGGSVVEAILTADRPEGPPGYYTTITMHGLSAADREAYIKTQVRRLWEIRDPRDEIVVTGLD